MFISTPYTKFMNPGPNMTITSCFSRRGPFGCGTDTIKWPHRLAEDRRFERRRLFMPTYFPDMLLKPLGQSSLFFYLKLPRPLIILNSKWKTIIMPHCHERRPHYMTQIVIL